jgi:hypothetical protein
MSSYYRSILNVQAVAAFVPTDISGCQLWLDAADDTTISIGTGVSQWNDKSGNARHAVQAVGANQPAYNLAAVNGLNAVNFDGNDFLDNDNMPLLTAKTAYVVLKANTATGGSIIHFRRGAGTRRLIIRELFLSPNYIISGDSTTTNQRLASAPSSSWQTLHQTKFIQNGSTRNVSYFLNGVQITVNLNPPESETATALGYSLANFETNTGSKIEFYNGLFCEIVVYNRDDISSADDLLIRTYLANKWAI